MVKLDDFTIFIIGGDQNGSRSNKTWIVKNPDKKFQIQEGPTMNSIRYWHTCGKMILNGKIIIVVTGGYYLDSVELLDVSSKNQCWILGKL